MKKQNELSDLISEIIAKSADETSRRIEEANLKSLQKKEDVIFVVKSLSEYLDLKPATIYSMTSRKQIPFYKKGKKLYFKKSEIDKWLDDGRVLTNADLDAVAERMQSKKGGLK